VGGNVRGGRGKREALEWGWGWGEGKGMYVCLHSHVFQYSNSIDYFFSLNTFKLTLLSGTEKSRDDFICEVKYVTGFSITF
jgi:hypothetical protein